MEKSLSLYERLCKIFEFLPLTVPKSLEKNYKDAIEFSHLSISPKGAFNFGVSSSLFLLFISIFLLLYFNSLSFSSFLLILFLVGIYGYSIIEYPIRYAKNFRIKASSEMTLCIIYMSIAMRITPNLENAIKFAAQNLTGPLALDLKDLLWKIYARKYYSIEEAFDNFAKKWKYENEEFANALNLIKNSLAEPSERMEKSLDEAINVMIEGTKYRMKNYAISLRAPVNVINALGILLPIIGLIFLPIVGIFMPELVQPFFIAIGYTVMLPITLYWLIRIYLEKRPYTFHQPDLSLHPRFSKVSKYGLPLFISISLGASLVFVGSWRILIEKELFNLLSFSYLISWGIASSLILHFFLTNYKKMSIRNEIIEIENEFTEVLFELSSQLRRGIPLETSLRRIVSKSKDMKISNFFQRILFNIENFGMNLEQAVFDRRYGAIWQYPSRLIHAIMHSIVEISKKGMKLVSKTASFISSYLKDINEVEYSLKEMLSETTSSLNIQSWLLAPLTSGIVVALSAIILQTLGTFTFVLNETGVQNITQAEGFDFFGGQGFLNIFVNMEKVMPPQFFQIVVGIYMIEIVFLMVSFLSVIENGEDVVIKRMNIAKTLLIGLLIYTFSSLLIYSTFSTISEVSELL